jgi:hypothetical protein
VGQGKGMPPTRSPEVSQRSDRHGTGLEGGTRLFHRAIGHGRGEPEVSSGNRMIRLHKASQRLLDLGLRAESGLREPGQAGRSSPCVSQDGHDPHLALAE